MTENQAIVSILTFKEVLSRHQVAQVVFELVKCLIFQRHQIPMTMESMIREVNNFQQQQQQQQMNENCLLISNSNSDTNQREQRRQRSARIRKEKLRLKLIKKSEKFMANFQVFETLIFEIVKKHNVKEIVFTLGLSSSAPREVYVITLPDTFAPPKPLENQAEFARKIIRVLRPIMCNNENLFDFLSEKSALTNMFVAFKMNLHSVLDFPPNLTPKMNFVKWPQKSKICHFTIQPSETSVQKKPASITGIDTYTPTAMQMCTPFTDTKFARKRPSSGSSSLEDQMIETPIQKTKIFNITHSMDEIELSSTSSWTWFYCNSVLKGFRDPQVVHQN